ncbi:MAG: hypothetical protein NZ959_10875 [Armatimonadetes bacterium]|nr:hypothetical protein [Armatimonadota bacterium]MDW8122844.1 hypothetical protein [Armatimonadota bacterium]
METEERHGEDLRQEDLIIGSPRSSMDDKGRFVLPAELRQRLGQEIYVTISPDDNLYVFDPQEWKRYSEALMARFEEDREGMVLLVQRIMGMAAKVRADGNWRFLVPQRLREICRLQGTIFFFSRGDRIEVMNEQAAKERFAQIMSEAVRKKQAQLGF